MKSDKKILGAGLFTALAASLCCITPVLAIVAGTSGAASSFSWLEPFRPYLIGFTVLVLGFAWYQHLKPSAQRSKECACEEEAKPKVTQSKKFLGIVTLVAIVLISFPYYSQVFYTSPTEHQTSVATPQAHFQTVSFGVSGMTCSGCEAHVKNEVNKLAGIREVEVSYEKGNAIVQYDPAKANPATIEKAIRATGYKVTGQEPK